MKRLSAILLFFAGINASGQEQTFDIITYTPPKKWKKESSESAVQFTKQDQTKGTYCIITLMKSIPGTENSKENFDAAWETVVKEMVKVSAFPQMQAPANEDGWEAQTGYAPFESEGTSGVAFLVTSTGYKKMVNILILTNTDVYENDMTAFLESVRLKKPDLEKSTTTDKRQNTDNTEYNSSVPSELIKKSWKNTQNRKDVNGSYAGFSSNTYQFKTNGTYTFNNTVFQNYTPNYIITDEEGTYQVVGNTITLKPTKSRYHVHQLEKTDPPSKSGNIALETTQYSFEFTIIYNRQRLVLSTVNGNETKRDGTFNYYANGKMQKSYLYDAGDLLPVQTGDETNTQTDTKPAASDGFTYSSTNFDDGWASTVMDDYVLTQKGNIKVYLSYPQKYNASDFSGTGKQARHFYWDNYVAKYFATSEMRYNPGGALSDYSDDYIEGWAKDKQTNEKRYLAMVLTYSPNIVNIIIASVPNDQQLRQQFPKADYKFGNDLTPMYYFNRFAVGKNDLAGTWVSGGDGAMLTWYSTTTGNNVGSTAVAKSDVFTFNDGNTYSSTHNGATGWVGAMNTYQQKYNGTYTVTDWTVTATRRFDNKTETFVAWFEVVRGGRMLHLDSPGLKYTLFKEK